MSPAPEAEAGVEADVGCWRARAEWAEVQVAALVADKAELNSRVVELSEQVALLTEQVTTLSGILFGSSSEKQAGRDDAGDDGAADGEAGDQQRGQGKPRRGQGRGSAGHGRRDYSHLDAEDLYCSKTRRGGLTWGFVRSSTPPAERSPVTS